MISELEQIEELDDAALATNAPKHEDSPASAASLWHNRNFNIFWLGQTLSVLGDGFGFIALPLLVLQATGSVAQMGLVTATFGVAQLVAGVFAGPIVDRVNRRQLMILCDVARTLLYLAIPLGWWLAGPQIWLIYVVTALYGALSNVFSIAYITAVANLVDKQQITAANGRLQTTAAVSFIIGPMLAGLVSAAFGPATAIGIDAVSFAVSALTLTLLRLRQASAVRPAEEAGKSRLSEALAGVRFLWQQPVLRAVALLFLVVNGMLAGTNDLFIYYLKHSLSWSDNAVGIMFGASTVGALLSGLLVSRLRRGWGFGVCFLGGQLVFALALVAVGVVPPSLAVYLLIGAASAFGSSVQGICSMSLRQEITPDHLLGRVTAAFYTLVMALGPIGAAVTTAIAATAGAVPVIVAMGLIIVALTGLGLFTPLATKHPEQAKA